MKKAMSLSLLLGFVVAVGLVSTCGGEPMADKEALLGFLRRVPHGRLINWSRNTSACFWEGVVCDVQKQRILELRLPGVGLYGEIPSGTLGQLTELRVLSLRSNLLSGALPSDLGNARLLRSLYLQHNAFSGPLPASLSYWSRLTRLDLSYNNFSGAIPFSLNNLTHLTGLYLQNNSLTGTIPSIDLRKLVSLDLSNNHLNGSIPRPLARFNATSFRGNAGLCGKPLADCRPFFMAPSPSPIGNASPRHKKEKLSKGVIVAIVVGSVALLFLLAVCLILLCARRRRADRPVDKGAAKGAASVEKGGSSSAKDEYPTSSSQEAERNKLVFFQGSQYTFDLEDLLRASAEVLGKGSVGTSYKAVLEDGTTVVVKRLKDVVAARKDFEQQMELVGRIRHPNLVPLRAFYFSKDEKLLVYDYMPAGSLSALLHGSRGSGRTPLDWETRMKIAVSTARGIAHIHEEGGGKFTHGNIKSSNILLSTDMDSRVSDFGLVPLFSAAATANRIAGYRAPEVVETRKVTQKSDVYSFGVLVLELLTGKSPTQASLNEEGVDLPRWVQSVVREEWTAEVFDVELMRYNNIEEEMVQLLQIAMACVAAVPDQRPKMQDVVRMIQDMRPIDTTDDNNNNATRHSSSKESTTQTPEAHTPSAATP